MAVNRLTGRWHVLARTRSHLHGSVHQAGPEGRVRGREERRKCAEQGLANIWVLVRKAAAALLEEERGLDDAFRFCDKAMVRAFEAAVAGGPLCSTASSPSSPIPGTMGQQEAAAAAAAEEEGGWRRRSWAWTTSVNNAE